MLLRAGRQGNTETIRENFARRPRFSCIDDHQRAGNNISDRTSMRAFLFFEKHLNVELKEGLWCERTREIGERERSESEVKRRRFSCVLDSETTPRGK